MPDEVKTPAAEAPAGPSGARAALDEYRRRMAVSHGDTWGQPGITFGPCRSPLLTEWARRHGRSPRRRA